MAVIWRRHAVSIALVAIAAALGIYVLAVDRGRPTAGEQDARKGNLFTSFRRNEIRSIEVVQGGESIRLTRAAGDGGAAVYYLAAPLPELADQAAVDRLVSALEIAAPERRLSGDLDRHAIGVDSAKIRVTISMGTITYRLAVGNPAPSPVGASYAEIEGDGPVVVSRDLALDLARPRDSYRARTLVPYQPSALARIQIDGDGGTRTLSRGGWGGWQIAIGPRAVRVDREAFDKVLASLSDLRTEAFLSEAQADEALGAAPSRVGLVIVPNDSLPRAVFDVGGNCRFTRDGADREGIVAVRREPGPRVSACVVKEAVVALATPADRLADRHLFSLRPDEIEEISLVSGNTAAEIARKGTAWHLRRPVEGAVDIEEGNGLARSLGDLVADRVEPEGGAAAFAATGTVTVHKAGEPRAEQIVRIGAVRGDGLVDVLRVQDGARLAISSDAAKALVPGPLTLKSLTVTDETLAGVRAISVLSERTRQVLHRSPTGTWTLEQPRGFAPDPGIADNLAAAVAQLRADRWIGERDDGSYGFETPSRTIDLDVADADGGARTIRLTIGRTIGRGAAARRLDDPAVFAVSDSTLRAIDTLAIDRSCFMVDPAGIKEIKLGRGKRLSAGDLETAKDALSTMRAESALHLGPPRREEGFDRPQLEVTIEHGAEAGGKPGTTHLVIGAGDVWRDTNIFYARRDGVDASFVIAQGKVRPLLELR
jgi:hypothetical protein